MLVQYTGMDTHFCGPSMPYCRCIISFECQAKVDKVSRHSVLPSTVCVGWLNGIMYAVIIVSQMYAGYMLFTLLFKFLHKICCQFNAMHV